MGLSLYGLYLRHWLTHVDARDLLVVYADDLSVRPLQVMQAVERHLGLKSFDYGRRIHEMYNVLASGWDTKAERRRSRAEAEARVLVKPVRRTSGAAVSWPALPLTDVLDGTQTKVAAALTELLLPDVLDLARLAAAGLIASLPDAWRDAWGVPQD